MIKPDSDAAIAFLKEFHPDFSVVITAIDPETGDIAGGTFKAKDRDTHCKKFIEKWNGKRNLYFNVNPVRAQVETKATKEQVHSLSYLHVDCDPEKGKDIPEERKRILKMLTEFKPVPTVILDSGGGYQAFWKLKEPKFVTGLDHAKELEGYNKQLEFLFKSDHTHNIDRIMRIPQTVNLPNKKKRDAGRVAALASVVSIDMELAYELDIDFKKAITSGSADTPEVSLGNLPVVEVATLRLEEKFRNMILNGEDGHYAGNRSDAVFAVVCEMVRAKYDNETIAAVLLSKDFKISLHIYSQKNPEGYAKRQIKRARERAIHPELEKLNSQYFVACEGGKVRVFRETQNNVFKRKVLEKMSFGDFRNLYLSRVIEVGEDAGGKKLKAKVGNWWLTVKGRREYEHITFSPGGDCPANTYNLWRGFGYDSVPGGSWRLLKDHMLKNICSGNQGHFVYLIRWMAYAVQHPDEQGHVAIVMKGEQGTGKSVFARAFGKLFGQHFASISNSKHLTGSFNAHLRDCVVLFADEAFWAGDKAGEGVLKTLVTEEELMIEGKGQDVVLCKNYIHLLIASNHEWVIPANKGERRYFAVEVSTAHKRDAPYFKAIKKELEAGGYEAMLHELQNMDLSEFDIRTFPETRFLQEQKEFAASPEEGYLHSLLQEGRFTPIYRDWEKYVPCRELYLAYVEFAGEAGVGRRLNPITFGRFFSNFFKRLKPEEGVLYRVKRKVRVLANTLEGGKGIYVIQPTWCYIFPSLKVCRKLWDRAQGGESLGWGATENEEKNPEQTELEYDENDVYLD